MRTTKLTPSSVLGTSVAQDLEELDNRVSALETGEGSDARLDAIEDKLKNIQGQVTVLKKAKKAGGKKK